MNLPLNIILLRATLSLSGNFLSAPFKAKSLHRRHKRWKSQSYVYHMSRFKLAKHWKASLTSRTMSDISVMLVRLARSVEMMSWAMIGEEKREGTPTGSSGLTSKPTKGEVSMFVANKSVTSPDEGEISRRLWTLCSWVRRGHGQERHDVRIKKAKRGLRNNSNPITHQDKTFNHNRKYYLL